MKHGQIQLGRLALPWRPLQTLRWRRWLSWCGAALAAPWRHYELTRTDDPEKPRLREHEFRNTNREYAPLRYFI